MSKFTLEEVAKHCTSEDFWLVIDNTVWDLSKFLKLHPGGKGVLLPFAGKDATEVFYSLHNAEVLDKYRDKLCKGVVAGEQKYNQKQSPPSEGMPSLQYKSEVPFAEPSWIRGGGWQSPYHDESHVTFRNGVRALLAEHIMPTLAEDEDSGTMPSLATYQAMGRGGLLSSRIGVSCMPLAAEIPEIKLPGGLSPKKFDFFHEQIAHEEMGNLGYPGVVDGLGAGFCIGLPPILHFSSPSIKNKVGPEVLKGDKRICLAISEPGAGSDVAGISTYCTKSKDGSHYIVNGVKKWITNGHFADYFVTAAKGPGKGMSLLLVERSEGLSTKPIKTSYSPAAGTALVMYDEVKVPAVHLLGKENEGFKCVMANFNHERWFICAQVLSGCRLVVKDCMTWCQQRKAFGKPLIEQPVVRNNLARMVGSVESAYSWLESITYQMNKMNYKDQNQRLGGPIALLKYQVTRSSTLVSDVAVQIFGGRGITKTGMGGNVERFQRTFKFGSILGGSEEIMADLGIRQAFRDMPAHARL
jgi:alkylation response protein AidB-like acyl-CoA dehydrogenase/predicted heme/steroid binding protein